ncbi:MAG: hypothetical protein HY645_01360 [Acidobacteria bacterium]|nr:hypothetical protein [Acidobacteriota bacterium]
MQLLFFLIILLLNCSIHAAPDLIPLGPFGGDVRSLAVHPARPDTFFLGTADGQIFVSRDSGSSWKRLVPGLARRNLVIDNLVFDPSNPSALYAATWELKSSSGRLFRTRDGGETWESIDLGPYHSSIRAITVAPSNPQVIAVGISEGVLRSTDGGQSWERISRGYRSLYNVESLAFDPHDSETLYVGTWHLGWKTTDGGKKWQAIHQGMIHDSDMLAILVDPQRPQVLYSGACTGIYKSENSGLLWRKLRNGLPKEAKRTRTVYLDPGNSTTVYSGTTVGLFVSRDGGNSWNEILPGVVVNTIAVKPGDSAVILVGTDDAGILKSSDGGKSFVSSNEGFIHRQVAALAHDPARGRLFASILFDQGHGGFFVSEDQGKNWAPFNDGLGSAVTHIQKILPARRTPETMLGTADGLYLGQPPARAWQAVRGTRQLIIYDLVFADDNESAVFIASRQGLFLLDLRSEKLQKIGLPLYNGRVTALRRDSESGRLFAGTDTGIFRSEDEGKNWKIRVKGLPPTTVNTIAAVGKRLLLGTRKGIYLSDDWGESWVPGKGVYPIEIAAIQANSASEVLAADLLIGHLFRSQDGGSSWAIYHDGRTSSPISTLLFEPSGGLFAGTLSDGIYRIVAIETSSASAGASALGQ